MVVAPTRPRKPIAAMDSGPGPAKYLLPGSCGFNLHDYTKKKKPAFSFGTRHKLMGVGSKDSPGPAHYVVQPQVVRIGKSTAPSYSLFSRANYDSVMKTPGPDTYKAEMCPPNREARAPSYSFGSRTIYRQNQITPSPNCYQLPSLLGGRVVNRHAAASYSMTGRSKIGSFHEDMQKTPGPGSYKVTEPSMTKTQCPSYSINGRYESAISAITGPGPGSYSPENVITNRSLAPAFSFGTRHSQYLVPIVESICG